MNRASPSGGPSDGRIPGASAARLLVAGALAAALAGGCASGGTSGRVDIDPDARPDTLERPGGERTVAIEVTNDVTPPTSIVVYVEMPTGGRYRLGRVQPAHTEVFRYTPQTETRRIRLLAQTNQGALIRSDSFTVSQVGRIRWNVN